MVYCKTLVFPLHSIGVHAWFIAKTLVFTLYSIGVHAWFIAKN